MGKKLLSLALCVLLCAGVAIAAPRGEEMRIGVSIDAKNFDPQNCSDTFSYSMQKQIYETLYTLKGKTLVPQLAERYEMLDDCTYKFYLRKGVKFHNGDEMTAEDVVFSLTRAADPARSRQAKSSAAWVDIARPSSM